MAKLRVLLTGATGYIAGQVLPAFRDAYDLRLVDTRRENAAGRPVDGVEVIDILGADPTDLARAFDGIDVVVHCAYHRPVGADPQSQYDGERRNVDMMQRVYQLALDHGVRRVVAASTNQAAKWYEHPYLRRPARPRRAPRTTRARTISTAGPRPPTRPLGFLYACGSLGRKLEVVQLRIVVPREIDAGRLRRRAAPTLRPRARRLHQRARPAAALLQVHRDARDRRTQYGVPFQIFYGVSNNARTFWSITNARKVIGYQPEDDSEVRFAADIARLLDR